MKFSTKIFYSILLTTIFVLSSCGFIIYSVMINNMRMEYISHYKSFGAIIGDTFKQLETLTDQVNQNAARTLYQAEKNNGLPSNRELIRLMNNLGISSFHIANAGGIIIRSTDRFPSAPAENLFNFCKDYRLLVHGHKSLFRTPIIPDSFYRIPSKFTMIPNYNRKFIFEVGTALPYIGRIFRHAIDSDKNIKSIGFYTPTGFELGYISESGKYYQGRRNNSINLNKLTDKNEIIKEEEIFFNIKIPAVDPYCCECIYKKVTNSDGNYFYILRLNVSTEPLINSINLLRNRVFAILFLAGIFSMLISRILSNKLVSRLESINKTAANIIMSNNLDIRVNIGDNADEIAKLADTFNKMIQSLKVSQIRLVESEKKIALLDLAASVAHDIRSPLGAMEMTLKIISTHIAVAQLALLREAIQSVRDIANNLLVRYRHPEVAINSYENNVENIQEDINLPRLVLLSTVIESVISQKRREWQDNPCKLTFTISSNAKEISINAVPNQIKRILSNLLNNAYDALEEIREIHLELVYTNQLLLQIRDMGIGIPANKIQDVLNGLSLKHVGKGLGLYNAKQYMENIEGSLTLSSIQNYGTAVTLTFPVSH